MSQFILAHDLGTSGNKATLFTAGGKLHKSVTVGYDVHFFDGDRAEQDPDDWWRAVAQATRALLEEVRPEEILAVSFSGQMQGCVCVDREGIPLRPSLIWADLRASAQAQEIERNLSAKEVYTITGQRLSSAHTLQKLMWVRDNQPEVYGKTHKVLQCKDYIVFKLTGVLATEFSDGCGTNCMDIRKWGWSDTILKAAGVEKGKFPDLYPSTAVVGKVTGEAAALCGLLEGTPVVCGGGDGATATVGAGCVREGEAYASMGTSGWIAFPSDDIVEDEEMRFSSFVNVIPQSYIPLGNVSSCGTCYSWMKRELAHPEVWRAREERGDVYQLVREAAATSPAGSGGVLFLPHLAGERCPWWNPDARGAFVGLRTDTRREDMMRAVMEGVALLLDMNLGMMERKRRCDTVNIIGGGAKNPLWVQIMADVMNRPVRLLNYLDEAASIGAAVTGGVGAGMFRDFSVVKDFVQVEREILPIPENAGRYRQLKPLFQDAYLGLEKTFSALAQFVRD